MSFADMSLTAVVMFTLIGIMTVVVILALIDRYRLRHDQRHPH